MADLYSRKGAPKDQEQQDERPGQGPHDLLFEGEQGRVKGEQGGVPEQDDPRLSHEPRQQLEGDDFQAAHDGMLLSI
jgi:hypothetical protein